MGPPNAASVLNFFYSQFLVTPPLPTTSCAGKTVVVTGANVGLGKESARHYVRLGAEKVILACRNVEAGTEAKDDIEKSEDRAGLCEVWSLDMSDHNSLKGFVKRLDGLDRLDIVLLNAGLTSMKFIRDQNGVERILSVNVYATMLLTLAIVPILTRMADKYSTTPHLTVVSSDVHPWASFVERQYIPANPAQADSKTPLMDALNDEAKANISDRYNTSKLLEALAVREYCARNTFEKTKVVINYTTPGLCHSSLGRDLVSVIKDVLLAILARRTDVGARCLVQPTLDGPETYGQYIYDCKVAEPGMMVLGTAPDTIAQGKYEQGEKLQKRVWEELCIKLEEIMPGVTKGA